MLMIAGCARSFRFVPLLVIVLAGQRTWAQSGQLIPTQANSGDSWSSPTFGQTITGTLVSGTGYSFGTIVTGTPTVTGSGGGAQLNTWASVTQTTGSTVVFDMSWRTRTLNESFAVEPNAHPTQPPLDLANGWFGLVSDVVTLDGLNHKPFLLQMSYVENAAWYDEALEASVGCLLVQWYNPASQLWVDATQGNFQNDPNRLINYQGSWASAGSPMTVGSWGVDTTNNVAWAVLDHNSQFAVAPEPGNLALAAVGIAFGACMWPHWRRARPRATAVR
jgi:hypothetical protein